MKSSLWWKYVVVLAILVAFTLPVVGVVRFFQCSSDTGALRQSVMSSVAGSWDRKISIRVGGLTTGLVRLCPRSFKLDPEPRAALDSLRGIEVGVYKLQQEPKSVDCAAILGRADKAMSARGWDRIVGLSEGTKVVAVYFPRQPRGTLKCSVLVFDGCDLVVASVRGNPKPLLELLGKRWENHNDS
jgi:hypothetical protein